MALETLVSNISCQCAAIAPISTAEEAWLEDYRQGAVSMGGLGSPEGCEQAALVYRAGKPYLLTHLLAACVYPLGKSVTK